MKSKSKKRAGLAQGLKMLGMLQNLNLRHVHCAGLAQGLVVIGMLQNINITQGQG